MWFTFTEWSVRAVRSNLAHSRTEPTVRTLVIALIVGAVVAVGGGQVLEARATDRVTGRLAVSTAGIEGVDVDLEGFPVAFRAAVGRLPRAVVEVERMTTRDPEVTFAPVVLDLREVRFDPVDLAFGDSVSVTVGDGTGAATLRAGELTRLVVQQTPGWDLRLERDRLIAVGEVQGVSVRVVADVAVADRALQLTAREVAVEGDVPAAAVARAFDRSVPLPDLPGRVALTEAEVTPAGVVLRAEFRGSLDVGA